MGAGAAVVSTPYWHAQECSRGTRPPFPFKDHVALSKVLLECSARERAAAVRDAARVFAHSMAWPRIGDDYYE